MKSFNSFNDLWPSLLRRSVEPPKPRTPYMYVLVRADLPPGLQAAQAAHAASYLAASNPLALYQHPTTIILNVADETELNYYARQHRHQSWDPKGFMFYEPDLQGEATAFACYTTGEEFSALPLALRDAV